MAEEDSYNSIRKSDNVVSRISSDFQCFLCGAIFTTHEDKKQHLEKEEHGKLHWWYYVAEIRDCKISRTPKPHKRLWQEMTRNGIPFQWLDIEADKEEDCLLASYADSIQLVLIHLIP